MATRRDAAAVQRSVADHAPRGRLPPAAHSSNRPIPTPSATRAPFRAQKKSAPAVLYVSPRLSVEPTSDACNNTPQRFDSTSKPTMTLPEPARAPEPTHGTQLSLFSPQLPETSSDSQLNRAPDSLQSPKPGPQTPQHPLSVAPPSEPTTSTPEPPSTLLTLPKPAHPLPTRLEPRPYQAPEPLQSPEPSPQTPQHPLSVTLSTEPARSAPESRPLLPHTP